MEVCCGFPDCAINVAGKLGKKGWVISLNWKLGITMLHNGNQHPICCLTKKPIS